MKYLNKYKIFESKKNDILDFVKDMNVFLQDHDIRLLAQYQEDDRKVVSYITCLPSYLRRNTTTDYYKLTEEIIEEIHHYIDFMSSYNYKIIETRFLDFKRIWHRIYDTKANRWGSYRPVESIFDIQDLDWNKTIIYSLELKFMKK